MSRDVESVGDPPLNVLAASLLYLVLRGTLDAKALNPRPARGSGRRRGTRAARHEVSDVIGFLLECVCRGTAAVILAVRRAARGMGGFVLIAALKAAAS